MKYIGVAVGAAAAIVMGTTIAVAGRSAATPLELVVAGEHEAVPVSLAFPFGIRHRGTFTASAPFCPSGTFADITNDLLDSFEDSRLYTCADGSGELTTAQEDWFEHKPPYTDTWRIVGGSDRYAGLRGRGTYRGEFLSGNDEEPLTIFYRSTYHGLVDFDTVAPTATVSSVKLRNVRQSRTYVLRLTLSLRDNEPGNRVTYTVAVEPAGGGLYLVERKGSTVAGTLTMSVRFRPASNAHAVLLQLGTEDPVGNTRWATRKLALPR